MGTCSSALPAGGWRRGQRQVEDVVRLARSPALADRHDARIATLFDRVDGHRFAEHRRLERDRDVIVEHACPAADLLGVTVGIYFKLAFQPLPWSMAR